MFKRFYGAALAALLLCTASAQAANYKMTFTASGFYDMGTNPQIVTGSLLYSAATPYYSRWTALTGIDLTIAGHKFSLAEVGTFNYFGGTLSVGGLVTGVNGVSARTDDFYLSVLPGDSTFYYSLREYPGLFEAATVTKNVTEVAAVPEPQTYAMLLAGLGLMGFVARRRKA